MSKPSVITDYSKEPEKDLDNLANGVYKALLNNPNFTWGDQTLAVFLAKAQKYQNSLEIAQKGTTHDTNVKNADKAVLLDALKTLATEVNRQAQGDLIKLGTSGFKMAKERATVGLLPKPTGFKVSSGRNSGDILCEVDALKSATVYVFFSAPVPAPDNMAEWRVTPSTTRKKNISGFIPGKQYVFKCAYQGSETELVYSDPITLYAQ